MIIDRIDDLLHKVGFPRLSSLPNTVRQSSGLHEILNAVDSAIGADTEWLSSLECKCLWHIGKACSNRRAIGARVRMLEEIVALNDLKVKFSV